MKEKNKLKIRSNNIGERGYFEGELAYSETENQFYLREERLFSAKLPGSDLWKEYEEGEKIRVGGKLVVNFKGKVNEDDSKKNEFTYYIGDIKEDEIEPVDEND